MTKIFLISWLIVFLVACAPQVAMPTVTDTATLTLLPVATLTPISTKTSLPTATEAPSPTAKPPDLILNSPSGEYIVEFDNAYQHPYTNPQLIEIFDKNGSPLWEIPYQHETAMSDPHSSLRIYGWSKDSTYLYFYYSFSPDGGDFAFWWDGFDVQRINVQNGEIEQVIPGDRERFVGFSFSPDETQIAYTRQQDQPSVIYIRNLLTGKEKTAEVIFPSKNYVRVGDIHWFPSGKEIAFQTETEDYVAQTIVLNLSTMAQKVVREYMVSTSYFEGWSENGNLVFFDVENGVNIVQVNPKNNATVVVGTPTPSP